MGSLKNIASVAQTNFLLHVTRTKISTLYGKIKRFVNTKYPG